MKLTAERKFQLLLQLSHKIRDTLDLDEILNHLLEMVRSIISYDAAGVFVLNQDLVHGRHDSPRGVIASVVWRGFESRPISSDPMLSLGKGIIGYVIKSGEAVVVPDVRLDPRYVEGRPGTISEIAVPIVRNERAIGAFNLESDLVSAYGEEDVEVLRFFADAAAISIEKAMLHRQILENQRIEKQLQMAQAIQSRLLPADPPVAPGYEIAGTCLSTYEIGGDLYDYIPLSEDRLGITVADVSGEGIPAALIMAAFRALLRTSTRREPTPAGIARRLNRLLPEFTGMVDFVTAVYGVLDPNSGHFAYVNCGHNPPLLRRSDGSICELKITGPGLSIIGSASFGQGELIMEPGDMLLLYTDGVVEATDPSGEEYGLDRLKAVIADNYLLTVPELVAQVLQDARGFSGSENFTDDFTLLAVKRRSLARP